MFDRVLNMPMLATAQVVPDDMTFEEPNIYQDKAYYVELILTTEITC